MYYETSLKSAENDPKKTWTIIREALNINPKNKKVDKLKVNGKTITDPKNIANEFNNFFADVGKKSQTQPTIPILHLRATFKIMMYLT